MNKNTIILSAFWTALVLMFFASCTEDMEGTSGLYDGPVPLAINASINGGTGRTSTRANVADKEDMWSYSKEFTDGDMMGFYSSAGNWEVGGGTGSFENQPLKYDAKRNQFVDPQKGVNFSPTHMNTSEIFMYYPYDKDMEGSGMELRAIAEDENDGVLRCKDFLSSYELDLYGANEGNIALYGEFDHAFSELIIMRGKGFDSPPEGKERITAVLSKPITHIKVNVDATDGWKCTPELIFNLDNQLRLPEDKVEDVKEKARKWDAWKGGNFSITTEDKVGREAWYIIVPTLGSEVGKKRAGERSIVDYIELYDNEGNLLQVKSLKLSGGNTKYVDAAWRYPMEITMEELVPTINPFPIIPWAENIDLTDERERGISNINEFSNWIRAYNTYLEDPSQENINSLLPYGDTSVDDNGSNRKWHFYILYDLDLSDYQPADDNEAKSMNVTISKLKDVLDGTSTTFVNGKFINHKITGLSKTFIGELTGSVQHIDFIRPNIKNANESEKPAGIIANTINDASVIDCKIDDGTLSNPGGSAGMVAGSMNGGVIRNCTISGYLVAKETTEDGLIGNVQGNITFDNNYTDVTLGNQ